MSAVLERKGFRAAVAGYLEGDRAVETNHLSRAEALISAAWEAFSQSAVRRPLVLPARASIIGVGGATIGGSNKTPLAVAVAKALARAGERVALVGHAYRSHARAAHAVTCSDSVAGAGDDALFAAKQLSSLGVVVMVGPSRQAAIDQAARGASWLVVDGLLQARPHPVACSLLALDGLQPWGRGRCPPAGDLRAPAQFLLEAADATVMVHDDAAPLAEHRSSSHRGPPPCWRVVSRLPFALDAIGQEVALSELAASRVGLILSIARPVRVVDALARRGIFPLRLLCFGDHDSPTPAALERAARQPGPRVDAWLTTEKCAPKLPALIAEAPVLALRHELALPPELVRWIIARRCS